MAFGHISMTQPADAASPFLLDLDLVLHVNFEAQANIASSNTMRPNLHLLAVLSLTVRYAGAQINDCQTTDLACHDIMNSSQCIEQVILEKSAPVTKAALVKCVEHEGTASSLPGAVKVGGKLLKCQRGVGGS